MGLPGGSDGKESAWNAGDSGLIPGLGISPGKGNGYPLQYSCLENLMDRGAWQATIHGVTKSQTQLRDFSIERFSLAGWDVSQESLIFFPLSSYTVCVLFLLARCRVQGDVNGALCVPKGLNLCHRADPALVSLALWEDCPAGREESLSQWDWPTPPPPPRVSCMLCLCVC